MDVQQLFKNLQKEAECPLCLETTINNPTTLPCLHSFYLDCLEKHAGLQTTSFKSLRETHSRICLHLIMSTDWWMFSLVKMAAHRPRSPRNAAVVMKTTKTVYPIENQRIMPEKEPGSTLKCLF